MTLFGVSFLSYFLNLGIILVGLFLILIILIQRGKGGGLAGAFGGAGGSSPFGAKAGDTFTRITVGIALVWALMIMIHVRVVQSDGATVNNTPEVPYESGN